MGAAARSQVAGDSRRSNWEGGPYHPDVRIPLASDRGDRGIGCGGRTGARTGLPRRTGSSHDVSLRPGLATPADLLAERLQEYDPAKTIAFLTRVAAMAPGIYHISKLLDQMQGKTRVMTILFYPGSIEGTTGLRFMDLKDREALGNYRVKIYG